MSLLRLINSRAKIALFPNRSLQNGKVHWVARMYAIRLHHRVGTPSPVCVRQRWPLVRRILVDVP